MHCFSLFLGLYHLHPLHYNGFQQSTRRWQPGGPCSFSKVPCTNDVWQYAGIPYRGYSLHVPPILFEACLAGEIFPWRLRAHRLMGKNRDIPHAQRLRTLTKQATDHSRHFHCHRSMDDQVWARPEAGCKNLCRMGRQIPICTGRDFQWHNRMLGI